MNINLKGDFMLYDTTINIKSKNFIFLNERKRSLMSFDDEFIFTIGQQNKNFVIDYMQFLAYTDLTLKTCTNIKYHVIMFFTWNRDHNNNKNFRQISMTQARNFFLWVKDNNYSYTRAKIIRTDLAGLGDFGEFVLGRDPLSTKRMANQWHGYTNFWRSVDICQTEDFNKLGDPNSVSFPKEKLETLRMYLSMKHDYIGLVILDYAHLGADILTLRIDSEDFNPAKKYSEQYLRWRERMGIIIPDVLVMKNNRGEYIPMGLSELRDYTRMFSVFLGREFVIC